MLKRYEVSLSCIIFNLRLFFFNQEWTIGTLLSFLASYPCCEIDLQQAFTWTLLAVVRIILPLLSFFLVCLTFASFLRVWHVRRILNRADFCHSLWYSASQPKVVKDHEDLQKYIRTVTRRDAFASRLATKIRSELCVGVWPRFSSMPNHTACPFYTMADRRYLSRSFGKSIHRSIEIAQSIDSTVKIKEAHLQLSSASVDVFVVRTLERWPLSSEPIEAQRCTFDTLRPPLRASSFDFSSRTPHGD